MEVVLERRWVVAVVVVGDLSRGGRAGRWGVAIKRLKGCCTNSFTLR